jgi:hypothetical protein
MKQLEQQVESLMGMVTNGVVHGLPRLPKSTTAEDTRDSTSVQSTDMNAVAPNDPTAAEFTSEEPTDFEEYDPVNSGLVDEDTAATLLDRFCNYFTQSFPFVVLDVSISVNTMRREQPFLFLSIMAAMAYKTPNLQRELAEEFKNQVAERIMSCSLKGLETLQGLLIYSAYYHFFYRPGFQQLSLIVQMCVATAQELGPSKRPRYRTEKGKMKERSSAEDRALLGTYYLAAA